MEIIRITFNAFGVNTYIVFDPVSRECAVIDPGMVSEKDRELLSKIITENNLLPTNLINTHLHVDHVMGNDFIRKYYNLKLKANKRDEFLGEMLSGQKRMFGLSDDGSSEAIEEYLSDGDEIRLGNEKLKVLEVPGHSPGGISLYSKKDNFVITGDSLFEGSIGRTDLPGGDMQTLLHAINKQLLSLPDDTMVYPGHGNPTTIGNEKRNNPFLR